METDVRLREDGATVETSKSRPLQGQSPFVVNTTLAYDSAERGTSATLLFNVFGRRISEVGAQGLPDVYERPHPQIDLTLGQRLRDHMRLSLTAKNLLDPDYEYAQGGEIYRRYKTGRSISVGLLYDL
jgi:outer membrane receptor protein involved in Fe transport